MNKAELVDAFAEQGGINKAQATRLLAFLADIATNVLRNGKEVTLPGLGKLVPVTRQARRGRNPQTGAAITIQATRTVTFRPLAALKDDLNADA